MDVTDLGDLERFFIGGIPDPSSHLPIPHQESKPLDGAWTFLSFCANYSLGFVSCPLYSSPFSPIWT